MFGWHDSIVEHLSHDSKLHAFVLASSDLFAESTMGRSMATCKTQKHNWRLRPWPGIKACDILQSNVADPGPILTVKLQPLRAGCPRASGSQRQPCGGCAQLSGVGKCRLTQVMTPKGLISTTEEKVSA